MARSKRKARRGLPSPRSVVAEMPLIPGGTRPGRLAAAPGMAPTYRILRTTEVDPYDTPVPALSIPAIGAPAAAPAPPSDSFKGKARKATKLSIVAGAPNTFDDLKKLISDLPPDKDMEKAQAADHHQANIEASGRGKAQCARARVSVRGEPRGR